MLVKPSSAGAPRRRVRRRLVCAVFSALLATLAPVGSSALIPVGSAEPDSALKVMTRNLYLGSSLQPLFTAVSQQALIAAMTTVYANVQATNFPERAEALASEIADAGPHLVGLQEARLWRSQTPADSSTTPNATHVEYDFVQILLGALARRGLQYAPVNTITTTDREVPRSTPRGLQDVRFTDRDVILARASRQSTPIRSARTRPIARRPDCGRRTTQGSGANFACRSPPWARRGALGLGPTVNRSPPAPSRSPLRIRWPDRRGSTSDWPCRRTARPRRRRSAAPGPPPQR